MQTCLTNRRPIGQRVKVIAISGALILFAIVIGIIAFQAPMFSKPRRLPSVAPLASSPSGADWSFVLNARDYMVAINRESRWAVLTRSGIIETNSYDAGNTTLIRLSPSQNWTFSVSVPNNATQIVVTVPCDIAPVRPWHFVDLPQSAQKGLERILLWTNTEVHSAVWFKDGDTWKPSE